MRPVSLLQSNNLLRRVSQWMRHQVLILKIMPTVGSRWQYRSRPSKKFNRTSHSQRLETHIRATKIKRGSTLYQGALHLSLETHKISSRTIRNSKGLALQLSHLSKISQRQAIRISKRIHTPPRKIDQTSDS